MQNNDAEHEIRLETFELQHEISQREGVSTYQVLPHENYTIQIGDTLVEGTGPAVISVNID